MGSGRSRGRRRFATARLATRPRSGRLEYRALKLDAGCWVVASGRAVVSRHCSAHPRTRQSSQPAVRLRQRSFLPSQIQHLTSSTPRSSCLSQSLVSAVASRKRLQAHPATSLKCQYPPRMLSDTRELVSIFLQSKLLCRNKAAPLSESHGAIELEILTSDKFALRVELVVN